MTGREFSQVLGISHEYLRNLEIGLDPRSNKPINPSIKTFNKIEAAIIKAQESGLIFFDETQRRSLNRIRKININTPQSAIDLATHYEDFLEELASLQLHLNGTPLTQQEVQKIQEMLRAHFLSNLQKF